VRARSVVLVALLAACGTQPETPDGGASAPAASPPSSSGAAGGTSLAAPVPPLAAASLAEVLRVAAPGPFPAPGATPEQRVHAFARDSGGVLPPAQLQVTRVDDDRLGGGSAKVVRARQVIEGHPVDGHALVLAISERGVDDVRGYFVRASGFDAPRIDRDRAIATAFDHSGLQGSLGVVEVEPPAATAAPEGDPEQPHDSPADAPVLASAETVIRVVRDRAHLAWKVSLDTMLTKPVVYVDAYDGRVIFETNRVRHYTTGVGLLRRVDGESSQRTQTFGVAPTSGSTHRLYSSQQGRVVWSQSGYLCGGALQVCSSEVTTSSSAPCGADTCANFATVDARFTTSHEYFENAIAFLADNGLNSYDDRGARIRNFTLRDGDDFDNALYGGSDYVVIGDGSYAGGGGLFEPLTTSDVIFHELAHAVDAKAGPNFEYVGESGALSESWADMQAFAGRAFVDGHDGAAHVFGADFVPGDWHVQEACGQSDVLPASDDCGACSSETTCGDGVCADVETCQGSDRGAECALDCGACTPTAIAGDAVCNHGQGVLGRQRDAFVRNLADPKQVGQPDTYQGDYFVDPDCSPSSINDRCGVHTNSGVGNKWFTLLARGGAGRNDHGTSYAVTGFGASAAYAVALRTVRFKSTATDRYQDFADGTVIAAIELASAGTLPEGAAQTVIAAWRAVGITAAATCDGGWDCNDDDRCTTDLCGGAPNGVCSHGSVWCSDGNACNGVETCADGCRPGTPLVCNDGRSCTIDACNPANGSCYVSGTRSGRETGQACSRHTHCCSGICSSRRCR
jgi:Zn-dependent metalloprotease